MFLTKFGEIKTNILHSINLSEDRAVYNMKKYGRTRQAMDDNTI